MRTRLSSPICQALLGLSLAIALPSSLQAGNGTEITQVVVQPMPSSSPDFYRVSADRTPSGFPVPRYVSLKFGKVNARTGPSRNHPIAYQYRRRGLPLIVVAETEMWRKVRDPQGDEAWVRKPALSGARFAVLTANASVLAKPSADARRLARIETGALVSLETCEASDYCRVRTQGGLKGFVVRDHLWGAQPLD